MEHVKWSSHTGKEVDEGLSECNRLGLLAGIDELQVSGSHAHVHRDAFGVGEVYVAHDVQRFVIVGIESEILQQQVRAHDTYRVVIKAHPHAVGNTDQIGRVDVYLTIYQRVGGGALDGHAAFAETFETYYLIGYKAVDE